jgi:hypothetical protein
MRLSGLAGRLKGCVVPVKEKAVDERKWLHDGVDEMMATVGKRLAAVRWRPIKTAPKDGSKILVGWTNDDRVALAEWNGRRWELAYNGEGLPRPTHWQPLPLPPKKK